MVTDRPLCITRRLRRHALELCGWHPSLEWAVVAVHHAEGLDPIHIGGAASRGRFRDMAFRRGRPGGAATGGGERVAGVDRGPAGEPDG